MRFCCAYVGIARKRGWIPVIKLDSFPNQYLECEGENMWEYYFEPVLDISENNIKNSNIISLKENKKRGEKKENAEPQQVIKRVNEICALWGYEYIFIATEDNEYLEMFKNEFKERLIYVSQKRVHYVAQIDDNKFVNQILNIQGDGDFTRKYLTVLTALSKCDALLASMYCGAVFAARSWKDREYEVDEIMYY